MQIETIKSNFDNASCTKIKMTEFSDNIRFLRMRKSLSKESVAISLGLKLSTYATYESGRTEPPYEILQRIARFHHISIDLLLSVDIRKVDIEKLIQLEDNRIVLPITVDKDNQNLIEIIPHKARAGYLSGYSDPEYIESLQHISLPFLRNGKFRAFPVGGRSMPPYQDGSFIVGEYVEKLEEIKDGQTYILLTRDDGIVYKRVYCQSKNFVLHSDNPEFEPYEIRASDILEIWKFACGITLNEFEPDNIPPETVKSLLSELNKNVLDIKERVLK